MFALNVISIYLQAYMLSVQKCVILRKYLTFRWGIIRLEAIRIKPEVGQACYTEFVLQDIS